MDLKELDSFRMSDAIAFHDQLNPKLFHGQHLRPDVDEQLKVIAEDFLSELGIKGLDVKDITISGSNAAYSYTRHSDLDLHILVDMSQYSDDAVYQELFHAKKNLYNDSHDITINGIPVELYIQDASMPVVSLGEYSILKNKWLRLPTKRRSNLDQTATKQKYEKLAKLAEYALHTKDLSKLKTVLETIKRYRQAGLDVGGEFGPENLAYKMLRSQGVITKLYDLRDKLHSQKLSIEGMYSVDEDTEQMYRTTPTVEQLVIKYKVPKRDILIQLDKGIKVELKKNKDRDVARKIALNHLRDDPHYYNKVDEDYDPNGVPPGPEFKPTMPAGTVKVDVSDVYDWYKLGQHISNLKGLGQHDFGSGPPSTIMAFGSEESEHKYIDSLKKTGLSTTDIDPVDPKQPKGMKRQKTDPTYNVSEASLGEIGYADRLDDSKFDKEKMLKLGKVDGEIQGHKVMTIDSEDIKIYFLVVDNNISAYLAFENGHLKNIKNFTNTEGVVRGLIGYIVHIKQQLIKISDTEPLTMDGFKWLIRLIKTPKGLTITDQSGNLVDTDELEKEWEHAKTTGVSGPTSLIIKEHVKFGEGVRLHEHRRTSNSLLMPMNLYDIPSTTGDVMIETSLSEIGFANALGSLNTSDQEIISLATTDGKISQKPVLKYDQGNTTIYFFANDNKISALVLLADSNKLKAIKNFSNNPGQIFALVNYIVNVKNNRLIITPDEPLTTEGFQWIAKLIKNPTGLKVTDFDGNSIDVNLLKKEWEKSKSTQGTDFGPTGIVISESSTKWKTKLQENEASIMPYIYFNVGELHEASGYIPSEKQKNDPRFSTALTVDVKPDSIKKNAKAFGWLTNRAGVPPTAKASGKI